MRNLRSPYNNQSADLFYQIRKSFRGDFKVKGSRFVATVRKVITQEEAKKALEEISKEFHDATHNCHAWKVGYGKQVKYHYSDGGEPNNTAGLPIFKAIGAKNLTNVIVVVTRYFGGTMLGTGGLIRAYSKAATDALKKSEVEKAYIKETVVFKTNFEFVTLVHNIINSFKSTLLDSSYGDEVTFTVETRASKCRDFIKKLKDGTNGQVRFIR